MTISLDELGELGARHRAAVNPGAELTDAQCRHRAELVELELERLGVEPGGRAWYTAQRVDGRICGIWAHSRLEAGLVLSFDGRLAWLEVDDRLDVYSEYYPYGRRPGDRDVFPVTDAPLTRAELVMAETPAGALF